MKFDIQLFSKIYGETLSLILNFFFKIYGETWSLILNFFPQNLWGNMKF